MKVLKVISVAIIALGLLACENESVKSNNENTENPYSDEEVLNTLKFVGQGVLPSSKLKAGPGGVPGITVAIKIARKSMGCTKGFGLCKPEIVKSKDIIPQPDVIYVDYEKVDWDNLELLLAEEAILNMEKVEFVVDEDVIVENLFDNADVAKIEAKEYSFDKTLGSHGGFKIESSAIKN